MKRQLQGVVVSDKMQKTAVVSVSYQRKDSKYLKYYTVSRKFKAHDENNEHKIGDEVLIEATRPISRDKRWTIVGLIKKGTNNLE